MAKEKVITVMCAARLPEILVKRIDSAAASGGVSRAQFIAEACRMRLDGCDIGVKSFEPLSSLPHSDAGEMAGLSRSEYPGKLKPDMAALREICAGKVQQHVNQVMQPVEADEGAWTNLELPPCSECAGEGKWACADVSCGKFGVEQKPRW